MSDSKYVLPVPLMPAPPYVPKKVAEEPPETLNSEPAPLVTSSQNVTSALPEMVMPLVASRWSC